MRSHYTLAGAAYRVSRGEAEDWAVRIFTPHAAPCAAAGAASARSSRDVAEICRDLAEISPRSGRDLAEMLPRPSHAEGARDVPR